MNAQEVVNALHKKQAYNDASTETQLPRVNEFMFFWTQEAVINRLRQNSSFSSWSALSCLEKPTDNNNINQQKRTLKKQ